MTQYTKEFREQAFSAGYGQFVPDSDDVTDYCCQCHF